MRDISKAIRSRLVKGIQLQNFDEKLDCDVCLRGKMTRTLFLKKSECQTKILDLVHTDVCGPMREIFLGGARYFVEFIDDCSSWCEIRLLKLKVQGNDRVRVENQKGVKLKCLQSDNGCEYTSNEFNDFLRKRGIIRRLTVPHNPEQNGMAEKRNRTLNEMARCLLKESKLPNSF